MAQCTARMGWEEWSPELMEEILRTHHLAQRTTLWTLKCTLPLGHKGSHIDGVVPVTRWEQWDRH